MNKSFKLFAAMLLTGGFALSLSSCKDSEDAANGPTPEEMAHSKDSESAKGLLSVLSFTSQLDSLPDNWYANNYSVEPTIGTVNDQSTPFVRYVPVLNKEEAIAKYNSMSGQAISENSTSATFNIENVGSVKFNVLDQADCIATLDMNIMQQPHLTQVRFVPVSAMGENAKLDGEPYYNFGDIVELTEGGNKSYWICVRPCSQLEKKSTSHWMSFNLNDWDSEKSQKVPKKSVNIKKETKSGCKDYYLPTQLGIKSESCEHLQNLFRLLYVLDNPSRYANFPKGLGGISNGEFTQNAVEQIASFWESKDIWTKVLPPHVARVDLAACFQGEPDINAFYYGYHSGSFLSSAVSVHRAQLTGSGLTLAKDGEIEWKRNVAGVDFRNYANYGVRKLNEEQDENTGLPEKGFVVRYKTGKQLVGGGSGNDEDPTNSFTKKHPTTISDFYVYRDYKQTADMGSSVLGDLIENESDNSKEVCALQYSKDNPSYLGNNSFYIKVKKAEDKNDKVVLQTLDVSTLAYVNVLNALIDNLDKKVSDSCKFDRNYKSALSALYLYLNAKTLPYPKGRAIKDVLEYRLVDVDGNDFDTDDDINDDDIKKLAKVTINIPYRDATITSENKYNLATLEYNIKDKTYTVKPHSMVYAPMSGKYICELRAYSDLGTTSPVLKDGQTYVSSINMARADVKKACSDFVKNVLGKIKK